MEKSKDATFFLLQPKNTATFLSQMKIAVEDAQSPTPK